jgi:hypothetical protein
MPTRSLKPSIPPTTLPPPRPLLPLHGVVTRINTHTIQVIHTIRITLNTKLIISSGIVIMLIIITTNNNGTSNSNRVHMDSSRLTIRIIIIGIVNNTIPISSIISHK